MRDDVLKIVNREQLVSCMNNTKWKRVIDGLNSIGTEKRVKYIDSEQITNWQPGAWMPVPGYVEFSGGPTPFRYIEWLEVRRISAFYRGKLIPDRISDRSKDVAEFLQTMNLDTEETDESFIVYGYRRASQQGASEGTPLRGAPEL